MNLLEYLEKQAKLSSTPCVSYDELAEWPTEQIEEAKQQGCLVQTDDAEGIICRQCPKHCWKDVEIRQKGGRSIGVFFCEDEDCAGLIEIELERLGQWRIDRDKLKELGFLKKKSKRKKRRVSSELTKRQQEAFTLVHVRRLTPKQAAIEMRCKPQNTYKLLKKAEEKIKAQTLHSVNLKKARRLPEDRRSQVNISEEDI